MSTSHLLLAQSASGGSNENTGNKGGSGHQLAASENAEMCSGSGKDDSQPSCAYALLPVNADGLRFTAHDFYCHVMQIFRLPKKLVSDEKGFWEALAKRKDRNGIFELERFRAKSIRMLEPVVKACGFSTSNGVESEELWRFLHECIPRIRGDCEELLKEEMLSGRGLALLFEFLRPESIDSCVTFGHVPTVESREERREVEKEEFKRIYEEKLNSPEVKPLLDVGELGRRFFDYMFKKVQIHWPPNKEVAQAIAQELQHVVELQHGYDNPSDIPESKLLHIFSIVCPAYTFENGRYTFESLGRDIGYVMGNVFRAFVLMFDFFEQEGLLAFVKFVVVMADSEATERQNLDVVGLDEEEFRARIKQSNREFLLALPSKMLRHVETMMLTEVQTPKFWANTFRTSKERFQENNWAPLKREAFARELPVVFALRLEIYSAWIPATGFEFDQQRFEQLLEQVAWNDLVDAYQQGEKSPRWQQFPIILSLPEIQWLIKALRKFFTQLAEHAASANTLSLFRTHYLLIQGEARWLRVFWQVLTSVVVPVIYLKQQRATAWHKYANEKYQSETLAEKAQKPKPKKK